MGKLSRNVGERSYYFDKICLPIKSACRDKAYLFDFMANNELVITGKAANNYTSREIKVDDRFSCIYECMNETTFVCRSVNYYHDRRYLLFLSHRLWYPYLQSVSVKYRQSS